jgi:hypothetical protein
VGNTASKALRKKREKTKMARENTKVSQDKISSIPTSGAEVYKSLGVKGLITHYKVHTSRTMKITSPVNSIKEAENKLSPLFVPMLN